MRRQAGPSISAGPSGSERMPARPWPIPSHAVSEGVSVVAAACERRHGGRSGLGAAVEYICRSAGFEVGHVYVSCTEDGRIVPSQIWYLQPPESRFAGFVRTTSATRLVPGQGLPGQVVCRGVPVFLHPLPDSPHMPRAKAAIASGLRAACGYPLEVNPELSLVLEFLATGSIHPSSDLDTLIEQLSDVLRPHLRDLDVEDL